MAQLGAGDGGGLHIVHGQELLLGQVRGRCGLGSCRVGHKVHLGRLTAHQVVNTRCVYTKHAKH